MSRLESDPSTAREEPENTPGRTSTKKQSKSARKQDQKSADAVSDDEQPQWQATLRADARTREKALATSLENSIAQLRGTRSALARSEEQHQRLEEALSDTTLLVERLNRRIEDLTREKAELTAEVQELGREEKRAREEIENARTRFESAESDKGSLNSHIAWLQGRLDEAESDKGSLNSHIARLQGRLDEEAENAKETQRSFQDSRRALEAMLQSQAESLSLAEKRISAFINERARWGDRLRQLIGLPRSSLAYRQLADWRPEVSFSQQLINPVQSPHASIQGYPMQFPATPGGRNPYLRANSLPELLSWDDIDFVRCAFVTVLGRQPDPDGEAHFTNRIRKGHSKLKILWELRCSSEGPNHDPGIAGFDRALRKGRNARLPVIGWFIRKLAGREGDGPLERYLRVIDNRMGVVHAQLSHVEAQLSHVEALRWTVQALEGAATGVQQRLDELTRISVHGSGASQSAEETPAEAAARKTMSPRARAIFDRVKAIGQAGFRSP